MAGLLDDVKVALRVSSSKMDAEVQMLIDAAVADMKRIGVNPDLLEPETMDPICKSAVTMYCKGMFGFDNSDAAMFLEAYRNTVKTIANSPTQFMGVGE